MRKVIYILSIVMLGCAGKETAPESSGVENTEEQPVTMDVTGTWSNLSLNVTIKEPDSTVDVPAGEWENVLKIKPILTTFNKDSTFVSEYRTLGDSLFMTSTGIWWMKDDSLYMEEHGAVNAYYVNMTTDTVTFTGYLDWDQDGEADDLYSGTQTRK